MSESITSSLIRAPRMKVFRAVADSHTLANIVQPKNTTSKILDYDEATRTLHMQITHAPGPEGTRRFHLSQLEARPDGLVVYASAFETDDPLLQGEMKLHFLLEDAPGGSQVTVRYEGLPPAIGVEYNELGTAHSLENVAHLIEGRDA